MIAVCGVPMLFYSKAIDYSKIIQLALYHHSVAKSAPIKFFLATAAPLIENAIGVVSVIAIVFCYLSTRKYVEKDHPFILLYSR